MKNKLIGAGAVFTALIAAMYFFVPIKITGMITDYSPFTFDEVLQNEVLRTDYGINEKNVPEDYGFNKVDEFTIKSLNDDIKLSAWFVNSANSSKSIVLVHGRTSNRLKTMKYLELFKQEGIDTSYNILIPDLRNSGKSDPAETFMGYKFAEDLAAYLKYLKQERNQDTVVMYGFSMGAMAILTMISRPDLKSTLVDNNIEIEKIILDSPLSNVKSILKKNADEMNLPEFVFEDAFKVFNERINNYGEKMSISQLIGNVHAPVLILQGKSDKTTPNEILGEELKKTGERKLEVVYFENAEHVKAYQDERYKKEYTKAVAQFIKQ